MDLQELRRRLEGFEWNDFEVKAARDQQSTSAWETVSAFANTAGGWLVFGVREDQNHRFEILGVVNVDNVQNAFLSTLRNKFSRVILAKEHLLVDEGKNVLVFYIPEASRSDKPIYIDGDIRRSFVRKGASDVRCSEEELRRFLRDAASERYDGEPVDADVEKCFDTDSIRWYRAEYDRQRPGDTKTLTDVEFLRHWGMFVERSGKTLPTRASILLFGTPAAVNQLLPRPVVDFQVVHANYEAERSDERWSDRVVVEENLVLAWRALLERFFRHATHPFSVDPATLQRQERPPDDIAFREAAVNLLVHQDYGDHTRKASVRIFLDRTVFFNPGDAFAPTEELLDAAEREVRNPRIIAAFRRIGLSEQAGTGIRAIYQSWRALERVPPILTNDKARKSFELALPSARLVSDRQLLLQAQLGVRLNDDESAVFALAGQKPELSLLDVRAVTGLTGAGARALAGRLVTQVLLEPLGTGEEGAAGPWRVASHLRRPQGDLVSDQAPAPQGDLVSDQAEVPGGSLVSDQAAGPQGNSVSSAGGPLKANLVSDQAPPEGGLPGRFLTELSEIQRRILKFCESPRTVSEIMTEVGLSHRTHFRRQHLDPLLAAKLLRLRFPDAPRHPQQGYFLTEAGLALVTRWRTGGSGGEA